MCCQTKWNWTLSEKGCNTVQNVCLLENRTTTRWNFCLCEICIRHCFCEALLFFPDETPFLNSKFVLIFIYFSFIFVLKAFWKYKNKLLRLMKNTKQFKSNMYFCNFMLYHSVCNYELLSICMIDPIYDEEATTGYYIICKFMIPLLICRMM